MNYGEFKGVWRGGAMEGTGESTRACLIYLDNTYRRENEWSINSGIHAIAQASRSPFFERFVVVRTGCIH